MLIACPSCHLVCWGRTVSMPEWNYGTVRPAMLDATRGTFRSHKESDTSKRIPLESTVLLVSEYEDRLTFDDLRDVELDRSIDELRVLRTQIDSIDATLAEMLDKPDV
jgi:hypothetical protein